LVNRKKLSNFVTQLKKQMKILFRSSTHLEGKSHDCTILSIDDRKFKFTYQAYNAKETFEIELFDGDKWNHLLNAKDIGIMLDEGIYISNADKRKARADKYIAKGIDVIKLINI
jgi:hypothetical protein